VARSIGYGKRPLVRQFARLHHAPAAASLVHGSLVVVMSTIYYDFTMVQFYLVTFFQ
jgi:hypothetical protein